MTVLPAIVLGFLFGMRHATDADHVLAVSTIVSRERSLRAAAPIGVLWGLGHTLTILLVGSAIVLFGVVITPRLGLGLELCVALMLVLLGGLNLRGLLTRENKRGSAHEQDDRGHGRQSLRPLFVGVVHGLAGSAAIALLVLGTIRSAAWAVAYLVVFSIGTIAGMLLITMALAMPMALTAQRFRRLHVTLALATGLISVLFGCFLIYEIGFTHGLFNGRPNWTPE